MASHTRTYSKSLHLLFFTDEFINNQFFIAPPATKQLLRSISVWKTFFLYLRAAIAVRIQNDKNNNFYSCCPWLRCEIEISHLQFNRQNMDINNNSTHHTIFIVYMGIWNSSMDWLPCQQIELNCQLCVSAHTESTVSFSL